jgi:hypothetical protein
MGSTIDEILSGEKINCDAESEYRNYIIVFWSPSDIRGIRIARYFSKMKKEYHDKGLGVIGIVVPETDPEKKREYIDGILRRYEIDICSVVDNDLYLWAYFNNQFLPNLVIMDDHDNMLEESSGADNIGLLEQKIDELTGSDKTSLREFWDVNFIDMKYILNQEELSGDPSFMKEVYSAKAGSVTLSGQWVLGGDGFPACDGDCSISAMGKFDEIFLVLETQKKDKPIYDSGGSSREIEVEGFNLIRLDTEGNSALKTVEIKIGGGIKIYSIQF